MGSERSRFVLPRWRLPRGVTPYLPGLGAYSALYSWVAFRGEFDFGATDALWQSLGQRALTEQPARSLWVNHIQPPGLNALYAVVLRFDHPRPLLQAVFALIGAATVLLIVSIMSNLGWSRRWAARCGLFYAILPTTVLHAFYPYNTSIVAFLLTACMWALSCFPRRPFIGTVVWTLAVVLLFLFRPTFNWVICLVALAVPWRVGRGTSRRRLLKVLGAGCAVIITVQAHYFAEFRLPTTSSWMGQNTVKALVESGAVSADDLHAAASGDPCLESIADNLAYWGDISTFSPSCFGSEADRAGTAMALDESTKVGGTPQQNSIARLELSRAWNKLAYRLVTAHPFAPLAVAFGAGDADSSFEVMLRSGATWDFVSPRNEAGAPFLSLLRPVGAIFPGAAMGCIVLGGLVGMSKRQRAWPDRRMFVLTSASILYAIVIGSLLEYGENMRFLTEVYPNLVVVSAVVLGLVLGRPSDTNPYTPSWFKGVLLRVGAVSRRSASRASERRSTWTSSPQSSKCVTALTNWPTS